MFFVTKGRWGGPRSPGSSASRTTRSRTPPGCASPRDPIILHVKCLHWRGGGQNALFGSIESIQKFSQIISAKSICFHNFRKFLYVQTIRFYRNFLHFHFFILIFFVLLGTASTCPARPSVSTRSTLASRSTPKCFLGVSSRAVMGVWADNSA